MLRKVFLFALLIAIVNILLALVGCTGPQGPRGATGPVIHDTLYSSGDWAKILDSVSLRSYMIGFRNEANGELILLGSGSAISQTQILTNAHVFEGEINQYILYKQSGFNVTPVAVQNGSSAYGHGVYALDAGGEHNDYSDTTVFTYDIGFFTTARNLPNYFTLPTDDTIRHIQVGEDIGTIGFPGETSDRLTEIVTATFKDGIISALVPFNSSVTPSVNNTYVVQHNFNNTPGTSGSPIFDSYSRLIAVHNSGAIQNVWNDATGSFTAIPVGSIGYGIRADVVNDMFAQDNIYRDTLSKQYIPNMYSYYPGSRICLKNGTKPVYLGTTMAVAKAKALNLLNTNVGVDSAVFTTLSDGSIYATDSCSYMIEFLKQSATIDNVWAIFIGEINTEYTKYYLPSFRDYWGITIGTSRSYILNTYGTNYTNAFSTDSTVYYYDYSSIGVGFGFILANNSWQCDYIQMAQVGMLQKSRAGATLQPIFPNLGLKDIPRISSFKKKHLQPINKIMQ